MKRVTKKKLHVLLESPMGDARVRNFPESTLLTILIYAKRTPRFSGLCTYNILYKASSLRSSFGL